jgi:hypothetical protein
MALATEESKRQNAAQLLFLSLHSEKELGTVGFSCYSVMPLP